MPDKYPPKLVLFTNVPVVFKLLYNQPKTGEGEHGVWFRYAVDVEGVEHSLFGDDRLSKALDGFKKGDTVQLVRKENKSKEGRSYFTYEANAPLFDSHGENSPKKPDITVDEGAFNAFRAERKNAMNYALIDAKEVVDLFNGGLTEGLEDSCRLDHQDLRVIAISMVIDFRHKTK